MKVKIIGLKSVKVPNFTVSGATLMIDEDILDFSAFGNGSTIEKSEDDNKYFQGAEIDEGGEITVSILFPYNSGTYPKGKVLITELEVVEGEVYPYVDRETI